LGKAPQFKENVMQDKKMFQVDTEVCGEDCGEDCGAIVSAQITVGRELATEILRLAQIVKSNGLYRVEKFSYNTGWVNAQGAEELTDSDCLNVSESQFWWTAYIKHTSSGVGTEKIEIADLAAHYGIAIEPTQVQS
jgi:hypothetical protein